MEMYELKAADQQVDTDYGFLLTVFAPTGPQHFAVDGVVVEEHAIRGVRNYTEEEVINVVSFPVELPYLLVVRTVYTRLDEADLVDRAKEHAMRNYNFQEWHLQHFPQVSPPPGY